MVTLGLCADCPQNAVSVTKSKLDGCCPNENPQKETCSESAQNKYRTVKTQNLERQEEDTK